METAPAESPLHVTCLCADWCGACRAWQPIMQALAAAHPELAFFWVDIEDDSDALGDLDIETFPTILVSRGTEALFFGPVEPSRQQLERLLSGFATASSGDSPLSDPSVRALVMRLAPLKARGPM